MTCGWFMRSECGLLFSAKGLVGYSCGCTPDTTSIALAASVGVALGLLLAFKLWEKWVKRK